MVQLNRPVSRRLDTSRAVNSGPANDPLSHTQKQLFRSLVKPKERWGAWIASAGAHSLIVVLLLITPLVLSEPFRPKVNYEVTFIAPPSRQTAPAPIKWRLIPPRRPNPSDSSPQPKPLSRLDPKPLQEIKRPEPLKTSEPKLPPLPLRGDAPKIAAPPKPSVRTEVFGSSVSATTRLPARQVQTGGFGDPNGMATEGRESKVTSVATLGSFDLPVGPGVGNGTGGAHGLRGAVASAGFGSGVAVREAAGASGQGGSGRGRVRESGFMDGRAAAEALPSRRPATIPNESPVEIIFKPRPEYTYEARRRRLEGEVLVEALFTAAGAVRVLRVTRGLGYGLDENAVRAVEQVRFKPAQRDGQPVDSTAIVHVAFQLAY